MSGLPRADAAEAVARAQGLIAEFCSEPAAFGTLAAVAAGDVPAPDRELLDHHGHMTVTMERHHRCAVSLAVVAERGGGDGERYAREIMLARPDGIVVQYGIVRIDLSVLDAGTAAAIRGRNLPLGRILIAAGVYCAVQRVRLLRIEPCSHLQALFGHDGRLHGRVAEIAVGGGPAIELLEVVVPALAPGRGAGR
ncbi:MAG: hypothetical protein ACKO4T_07845 [Planctomycetaceae bacterium]